MTETELDRKVKELRELRRMAEELTAELEAVTGAIKREMAARGVDTLAGDDWRATWKPVQSVRFDSRAFKAAMPELYDRFTQRTGTRRFILA